LLFSPQYPASCPSLSYRMRHAVLVSHTLRTCKLFFAPLLSCLRLSTLKNMPFNIREHALLDARKTSSWCKTGMFSFCIRNSLKSCALYSSFLLIFLS